MELHEKNKLIVALLQMSWPGSDDRADLKKAEEFCRQAAYRKADIALLPEMWNIGYRSFDPQVEGSREQFMKRAVAKDSAYVMHFAGLARELGMAVAVTYLQAWQAAPRNTVTLFDRHGREVYTYAKVHTCDFHVMEASMTPGTDFPVRDLDTACGMVKVGSMICFDREQPESARLLMLNGAELILTPNACGIDELRMIQFRTRAFENVLGVAMTNYARPDQNGRSCAFDASGNCLVEAGEEEGVYLAEFDMDAVRAARAKSIWGDAFRRPHRYAGLLSTAKDDVWRRTNANGEPFEPEKR